MASLDDEKYICWNFVASDLAIIEDAKRRLEHNGFDLVPDDPERIPLPTS